MTTANVQVFSDATFDAEVIQNNSVVLVDFWADWCGPCRAIAPVIEQLASDYAGRAVIGKLNVDDNSVVPSRYGIRGIPALLVFKGGEVVGQLVGAHGKATIAQELDSALQTPTQSAPPNPPLSQPPVAPAAPPAQPRDTQSADAFDAQFSAAVERGGPSAGAPSTPNAPSRKPDGADAFDAQFTAAVDRNEARAGVPAQRAQDTQSAAAFDAMFKASRNRSTGGQAPPPATGPAPSSSPKNCPFCQGKGCNFCG